MDFAIFYAKVPNGTGSDGNDIFMYIYNKSQMIYEIYEIVRSFIIMNYSSSFIFNFSFLNEWINVFLVFFNRGIHVFLIFKYSQITFLSSEKTKKKNFALEGILVFLHVYFV